MSSVESQVSSVESQVSSVASTSRAYGSQLLLCGPFLLLLLPCAAAVSFGNLKSLLWRSSRSKPPLELT